MTEQIRELFLSVIASSFKVSLVVFFMLVLTKLIEKRYSAGFRYYSWLAVIIIFLIPFQIIGLNYSVDIPTNFMCAHNEVAEDHEAVGNTERNELSYKVSSTSEKKEDAPLRTRHTDTLFVIALIWLAAAIMYFALHIKRYSFFRKTVRRISRPLSDSRIEKILKEEQKRLKIPQKIPIRLSPIADTPLLTGLFKAMLILPRCDYTDEQLHFILRHELIHYKRKDIWYQFVTLIFISLHWFNPFVHLMAHAVEIDGETSCDEAVLRGSAYESRILYGEMLIAFLKTENQKRSYLTTTFFGGEKAMKKRLRLIASKKSKKRGTAAMLLLISIAVMASVTVAAGSVEFVDSRDMVKNSSNRENTVIMDTGEGYDVFIGCEPIYESHESVMVPLKKFIVFIDYTITSEIPGNTIAISNGNRGIELSAGSGVAKVNGNKVSLKRKISSNNGDFHLSIEDIEALFSYMVSYDSEKNNVVLTETDKTPKAVKTTIPPASIPKAPPVITVRTQGEELKILINNTPVAFHDAQPFVDEENRTLVPLRAFAEMLNCKVEWDESSRCALITGPDNTSITFAIGDRCLRVNGRIINMDIAPVIISNRTYAPLYYISEALKLNVFWES